MTGYIASIPRDKFFGFIKVEGGKAEYFFHRQDFDGEWDELRRRFETDSKNKIEVEFTVRESSKGPRAAEVRIVD